MTQSHPGIFLAKTQSRRALCREHFRVILAVDHFPNAVPGQFLQVLCDAPPASATARPSAPRQPAASAVKSKRNSTFNSPMLRRPFSIGGLRRDGNTSEIELIGRVVGQGTAWLSALEPGDSVDVLGPLGHGFTPPSPGNKVLLLAGGVGLPPIRWWGQVLREQHRDCEMIYGAQSRDTLPVRLCGEPAAEGDFGLCVEEFAACGIPAMITTDDGSCGLKGRVTDGLLRHFAHSAQPLHVSVYACGSLPMLRAVASICAARGVPCELAMERLMACGMGTCQSCVLPVDDHPGGAGRHYALCCTDGPVFDACQVCWSELR